jgi:beta-galactosidase
MLKKIYFKGSKVKSKATRGPVIYNNNILKGWERTCYTFENYTRIEEAIREYHKKARFLYPAEYSKSYLKSGPTLFQGEFQLSNETLYDTYIDTTGWGKGMVFINGFNLGRFIENFNQFFLIIVSDIFQR